MSDISGVAFTLGTLACSHDKASEAEKQFVLKKTG